MIRHIFIAPLKNAPAKSVDHVDALEGEGLEGDRYAEAHNRKTPDCQVTFIELEAIRAFTEQTGLAMTPGMPRRNIVTEGVRLNPLVGKRFRVGEAIFEGVELCEPCGKFALAAPGAANHCTRYEQDSQRDCPCSRDPARRTT